MSKLYFTYGQDEREGFERVHPSELWDNRLVDDSSVDEIQGQALLEMLPENTYVKFFELCHRILKPEATAAFSVPHFASTRAWQSPFTKRAFSETSLSFLSKEWRKSAGFASPINANFDVAASFAIEETYLNRSDAAREFGMKHYNNIVLAILFTLTKRPLE